MTNIKAWLATHDLAHYADSFARNDIDLDVVGDLAEEDLKELGLSLGDRKRFLRAAAALRGAATPAATPTGAAARPAPRRKPTAADPGQADRRQLTVMVCDLVGSTALSTRHDPEDLREIIAGFQSCCSTLVQRFGGTVVQFLGDGVLVYFGYPQADEYAPERAVKAALEIVAGVQRLEPAPGVALNARVGIATGDAVVGDLKAEGMTQERAAIGQTTNLAARLESLAKPGTVVIADATWRLVDGLFDCADLGEHALKGFQQPTRAWQVRTQRVVESRFEATHPGTDLRDLVGRDPELALLLDCWREARAGRGQVVLLRGEPGIGKSRLIQSLRQALCSQPHSRTTFYCVPYHQSSALFPVLTHLQREAGFGDGDPAELLLDKLEALLAAAAEEMPEAPALLAALLSIPDTGRYPRLDLGPRLRKQRTLRAIETHLLSARHTPPLLMVFEDLHWSDPTTHELLDSLVERVAELPILLVCSYRPELQTPWSGLEHIRELTLGHLDRAQAQRLVTSVAGGKALPAQTLEQILSRTDGVPLFIEELTKMVLESGLLTREANRYRLSGDLPDISVPSTLKDSLMARLDRLSPVKYVAQVGASIGRRFGYELLARAADVDDAYLATALDQLTEAGIVQDASGGAKATYLFKHALIQDAAYASLLRGERQQIHARIAQALERSFPDVLRTEPESLAHHFTQAGRCADAIPYWLQAGQRATERAAYAEAQRHVDKGLELLATLPPDNTRDQLELRLQVLRARILVLTRGYTAPQAEACLRRAHTLCAAEESASERFAVLSGLCEFYIVRGELEQARPLAEDWVDQARRVEQPAYLIEAYTSYAYLLCYLGELEAARTLLEENLALYDAYAEKAFRTAQDPGVACLAILAIVLWLLGHPGQAQACSERAVALALERRQPFSAAYAHTHAAFLHQLLGQPEHSREQAEAVIEVSTAQGFELWLAAGVINRAVAHTLLGEAEQATAALKEYLAGWRAAGAELNVSYYQTWLARALGDIGRVDEARAVIADAFAHLERTGERYFAALLHLTRGELSLLEPERDPASAEQDFRRALEIAREQRARLLELRAARRLHALQRSDGRGDASRATLEGICDWFDAEIDCPDLREARALLATP